MSSHRPASRGDDGAATMFAVSVLGLLTVVTLGVVGAVGLIGAHRVAQNAADLAALGAASGLQEGRDACPRAAAVARRNHAQLESCRVLGEDVVVEVSASVGPLAGRVERLTASARAGPATP